MRTSEKETSQTRRIGPPLGLPPSEHVLCPLPVEFHLEAVTCINLLLITLQLRATDLVQAARLLSRIRSRRRLHLFLLLLDCLYRLEFRSTTRRNARQL